MRIFKYNVVNFKKINLKGITKFAEKYGFKVNMSVKMDSNGIGLKVYDEESKVSICTYGVNEVTLEQKNKVLGDKYDENNEIDRIYMESDYELVVKFSNADEYKLAYLLALYISSCTDMVLFTYPAKESLSSSMLNKIDKKKLNILVEQFKLKEKYGPEINKWTGIVKKATVVSFSVWALAIGLAIFTVAVFIFMLETLNISNGLLLALPFAVLGILISVYFIKRWKSYVKAQRKLRKLYYEYDKCLCELYEDRLPKEPSDRRSNKYINLSNIYGFMILPCIVLGCVFYFFDLIVFGTAVICLPWVLLIVYKKMFIDVRENNLKKEIFDWLDKSLSEDFNNDIVAMNVELNEGKDGEWTIELLGCLDFRIDNSMWSKNNICEVSDRKLDVFYKCYWEEFQYVVRGIINEYISFNDNGQKLKKLKCVVIGFGDGVVDIIYLNESVKKDV